MSVNGGDSTVSAIVWRDGVLALLDQRILPHEVKYNEYRDYNAVAGAIRDMVVRGAPAIGVTAAYGVVLGVREMQQQRGHDWLNGMNVVFDTLAASRPTAVNLFWALDRMKTVMASVAAEGDALEMMTEAAVEIQEEDVRANRAMGALGADFISGPTSVLTHCNAGALATAGYGTALGVIRAAHAQSKIQRVFADETRPWLQGARLTAWEMVQERIPVSLIAEGAAAALMREGEVSWVIVGADRIAANGDVVNKIGTYGLAIMARHHGVKMMVAAPTSTIDASLESGQAIPIEHRDESEVLHLAGQRVATEGASAWNPVFDMTPADLVDVIVTEKGVIENPDRAKVMALLAK